jgi:hypothetical protein
MSKKTIKLKFTYDDETGKIDEVRDDYNDSPGGTNGPVGTVTDSVSIVITKTNPICFNVQVGGVWQTFCY